MPAEVVISGGNAKRVVFGSLSLTGHRLLLVRRHQRSEDFQAFLAINTRPLPRRIRLDVA